MQPAQPAAAAAFCSSHAKPSTSKVPFLGESLGPVLKRQGYVCPCMTPSSLSPVAGVLHEAGEMQLPPNDHHLPPQKRGDSDSYAKSQVDFKAPLCSSKIWLDYSLAGNWQHSTHHYSHCLKCLRCGCHRISPCIKGPDTLCPWVFAHAARSRSQKDFSAATAGRGKDRGNFYPPPGRGEIVYLPWKGELPAQLHSEALAGSAQQPQHSESLAVTRQPRARAQDVHPDLTRRNVRLCLWLQNELGAFTGLCLYPAQP